MTLILKRLVCVALLALFICQINAEQKVSRSDKNVRLSLGEEAIYFYQYSPAGSWELSAHYPIKYKDGLLAAMRKAVEWEELANKIDPKDFEKAIPGVLIEKTPLKFMWRKEFKVAEVAFPDSMIIDVYLVRKYLELAKELPEMEKELKALPDLGKGPEAFK